MIYFCVQFNFDFWKIYENRQVFMVCAILQDAQYGNGSLQKKSYHRKWTDSQAVEGGFSDRQNHFQERPNHANHHRFGYPGESGGG